jgi:hypothetical protein
MSQVIYDSQSEALDVAAQRLAMVSNLPIKVLKTFGEKARVVEEKCQAPGEALPRQLQPALIGRFVIRDDELLNIETFLSLLKSATKLAVGLAGIATLAGVAAVTDALHGLYRFYCDIVAKGFVLSKDQLAVIATLRDLRAATTAQIAERVQERINSETIDEVLASFSRECEPKRGFISKDETGRWHIDGV